MDVVSATGTVLPCISQGTSNLIVAKGGNNVIDAPDVARVVYALLLAPVQVGECAATELQEEGNLPVMAGAAGEVFDLFLVLRIDDWALASEAADMFGDEDVLGGSYTNAIDSALQDQPLRSVGSWDAVVVVADGDSTATVADAKIDRTARLGDARKWL